MYIIQEIQTSGESSALTPAVIKKDAQEAESAFLLACSSACISKVPVHTVMCFDENGMHVFTSPRSWIHAANNE